MATNTFGQDTSQYGGSVVPTSAMPAVAPVPAQNTSGQTTSLTGATDSSGQAVQVGNPALNPQFNYSGTISTANTQTPSQPVTPVTPQTPAPYNVGGITFPTTTAYDTQTPEQQSASDLSKSTQDLYQQLVGESQFKTDQYKALGFGMTYDANGNIIPDAGTADLSAKLDSLKQQALAIPLQYQQNVQNNGQNIFDANTQKGIDTRQNALDALNTSALIAAKNGQLTTAQHYVDNAVIQKFGPIEAQINANLKNLQLIQSSPDYTNAEKRQAAQQTQLQNQQAAELALQKQNYSDAQSKTLSYSTIATPQQLAEMQQAQSPVQVAEIAQKYGLISPTDQTALLALAKAKADIANLPLDRQLKEAQVAEARANAALHSYQAGIYAGGGATNNTTGQPLSPTDFANGVPLTALGASQSPNPNDQQAFALATGLAAPSQYITARNSTTPQGKALLDRANKVSLAVYGVPFSAAASEAAFKFRNSAQYQRLTNNVPVAIQTIVQAAQAATKLNLSGIQGLNETYINALAGGYIPWASSEQKSAAQTLKSFLALNQDDLGLILGTGQGSDYKTKLGGLIFTATGAPQNTADLTSEIVNKITDKLGQYYTSAGIPNGKAFATKTAQDMVNGALGDQAVNTSAATNTSQQTYNLNGQTYVQGSDGLYYSK